MAFLTSVYIQETLGGAVTGAAKLAAFGDASAVARWIAQADAIVVSSAIKGGYSSVTSVGPSPASGDAFEMLAQLAFAEWEILAHWYGRSIKLNRELGEASSVLYQSDPALRVDLPGIERDPLGGSAGGDITNVSAIGIGTIDTAAQIFTRVALEGNGFC